MEQDLRIALQRLDALETIITAILPPLIAQAGNRPELEAAIDQLLRVAQEKPAGNEALGLLAHALAAPLGR